MKKIVLTLVLAISGAAGPMTALAAAEPSAGQPDNYGQCQEILIRDFGANPSEGAPGQLGLGPAVIIYDESHNVVAIHQASAFSFGGACNFVLEPSRPVQSAYFNNDGALVLVVRQA